MNCRPERRVLRRWATTLCAASLLAIGLPLAAQDSRSPAQNSLAAAERFAAAQNDRAARVELLNAVQKDPDLAPARIALAAISLRLADPDSAEARLYMDTARRMAARLSLTREGRRAFPKVVMQH